MEPTERTVERIDIDTEIGSPERDLFALVAALVEAVNAGSMDPDVYVGVLERWKTIAMSNDDFVIPVSPLIHEAGKRHLEKGKGN